MAGSGRGTGCDTAEKVGTAAVVVVASVGGSFRSFGNVSERHSLLNGASDHASQIPKLQQTDWYHTMAASHLIPYRTRTLSRTTQTAFCVPNPIGQARLEKLPQKGITNWLFFLFSLWI